MLTRYHVINRLNGKKFGDYGIENAAQERARVLNATLAVWPIVGSPLYEVRTVQTDHMPSASGELTPR